MVLFILTPTPYESMLIIKNEGHSSQDGSDKKATAGTLVRPAAGFSMKLRFSRS
jgi:hypothetical protein